MQLVPFLVLKGGQREVWDRSPRIGGRSFETPCIEARNLVFSIKETPSSFFRMGVSHAKTKPLRKPRGKLGHPTDQGFRSMCVQAKVHGTRGVEVPGRQRGGVCLNVVSLLMGL